MFTEQPHRSYSRKRYTVKSRLTYQFRSSALGQKADAGAKLVIVLLVPQADSAVGLGLPGTNQFDD
jgi:hypothetical protein